jgi:translation initiation factor IF-3
LASLTSAPGPERDWSALPSSRFVRSSIVSALSRGRRPITTVPSSSEPRINDRIRAREVRLVDAEGRQLGITPLPQALAIAQQQDLDLVEVAPLANPPVCRIMDYGKFKFDAAQRAKESRRKTSNVGIKEMKYRPKIGPGDFDTKTRQVLKFLSEGHKVKVTVMFRGREVIHPDLGKRILDKIAEQIDGVAKIETEGRLDGRNMVMVLAPDKRAKQSTEAKHSTEQRHRATTNGSTPPVPEAVAATGDVALAPAVMTEPVSVAAESGSGHEQVETHT